MTEPTWITAARAATAAERAAEAERAAREAAEAVASTRRVFLELLAACGIPTDHADLITDPRWGLVAVVDGYRFTRGNGPESWTIARLIACPVCTQEVLTSDIAYPESCQNASLGALFTDAEPRYHRCPGRPVGPEDYDEDGELIDRTPRATPPPPAPSAPSTGERIAAALERMVPLLDSIASAASYREFGAYASPLPAASVDEPLSVSLDDADLPPCEGCGQRGMCYCDGPPDADLEQRFDSAGDEDTVPDVSRDER